MLSQANSIIKGILRSCHLPNWCLVPVVGMLVRVSTPRFRGRHDRQSRSWPARYSSVYTGLYEHTAALRSDQRSERFVKPGNLGRGYCTSQIGRVCQLSVWENQKKDLKDAASTNSHVIVGRVWCISMAWGVRRPSSWNDHISRSDSCLELLLARS